MHNSSGLVYRSREHIAQLVHAFEAATLAPQQFDHHAHMTVALWYLSQLPFAEATTVMRTNIQHFAASHQQNQLYHETITGFWMRLLRHILDRAEPNQPFAELVYRTITTWGSMEVFFRHYSRECAFSAEARQHWVEPDLLPLPFRDPSV
ncbi:MAG: hypothetical protein ABIV47_23255 [Roseiflexaceae bacterium]